VSFSAGTAATMAPVEDPRLLARRPGFQKADYVERAADAMYPDAGEALSVDEQRTLSNAARRRFEEARATQTQQREAKAWVRRLEKAELRARSQQVDVTRHLAQIQREIETIERKVA
jgi:uncharacterized sporulation protein YeaH/YhbH (DUF444 family)